MDIVTNWTNLSSSSYERLIKEIEKAFEKYKETKRKKLTEDELLTVCANIVLSKVIPVNLVLFFLRATNFIPSQMSEEQFVATLNKKIETILLFREIDELCLKADRYLKKIKKARKRKKEINTKELWEKS